MTQPYFAWDSMHRVMYAECVALKARGFMLAIPGATHPAESETVTHNLRDAHRAGQKLGIYAVPGYEDGKSWVDRALAAAGDEWYDDILFVALDCETENARNLRKIEQALIRLEEHKLPPLIYTAYWWWVYHFGDPQTFGQSTWLMNAFYDGDFDFDFPTAPYGGWTIDRVAMEQFRGTHVLEGATIDANVIASWFYDYLTREESMAEKELRERMDALERVEVAHGMFSEIAAHVGQRKQLSDPLWGAGRFLLGDVKPSERKS